VDAGPRGRPAAPETNGTPIRIGYARCSTATQELQTQLDALAAAKCTRVFSEKISTRIRVRPEFEAALALAREIKAAAPDQPVILTVHEMKRLARNAAELMTLSATLQATGIQLQLLSGPLTGIYDPHGMGSMLFAVLAVTAQLDRDYIREKNPRRPAGRSCPPQPRWTAQGHRRRRRAASPAPCATRAPRCPTS
jgi:DNA invertase Pin-like site-specific DNA recombinase